MLLLFYFEKPNNTVFITISRDSITTVQNDLPFEYSMCVMHLLLYSEFVYIHIIYDQNDEYDN